jgi:hypothetical protein
MLKYFNSQAKGRRLSRDFMENPTLKGLFHSIFALRRQILDDFSIGKSARQMALVELVWDDGVLD